MSAAAATTAADVESLSSLAELASASPGEADSEGGIAISDAVAESALIVEGEVVDISYTYDDWNGPLAVARLRHKKTHYGRWGEGQDVPVAVAGGPLPNGRYLRVSDTTDFVLGASYVVFLTGSKWSVTPVVRGLALRKESYDSKDILVNDLGQAVVGLDRTRGIRFGQSHLYPLPREMRSRHEKRERDTSAKEANAMKKEDFLKELAVLVEGAKPAGDQVYAGVRTSEHPWNKVPLVRADQAQVRDEPCVDGPVDAVGSCLSSTGRTE